MVGKWQSLFAATQFTNVQTRTSPGLHVGGAAGVQFAFWSDGVGAANLSAIAPLFDPQLTDGIGTLLAVGGTQNTAPLLSTIPDTASYSFGDVTAKQLTVNPLFGYVVFLSGAGLWTAEGICPFSTLYLQLTSSASIVVTCKARVVGAQNLGTYGADGLTGSVI